MWTVFLLLGTEKALLIDTAYGRGEEYLVDFITAAQHVVDGKPDLVSFAHLPGFMQPFDGDRAVRVQVGNSCINYIPEGVERRMKF